MKNIYLLCFALFQPALELTVNSAAVVAPFVSGSGSTGSPDPVLFPVRYQQVYQAGDFLSAMPQGGRIVQLAFRIEETLPNETEGNISRIQIDLSTTQRGVNSLSPVFAENIGPDDTTVFGPSSIYLSGRRGQFDFVFQFTTPFVYDPRAGNLLMDVRNYSGAIIPMFRSPPAVDAVEGGTSSRIFNPDVNASTANFVDSIGAITQFTFTPVPEPSGALLATIALACWLTRIFWKRRGREI